MYKTMILLFVVLFSTLTAAQESYRFQHLTVDDGLAQANISDILQDSLGQIWIATTNGLNLYDGYELVDYVFDDTTGAIENNYIFSLAYNEERNELWTGHKGRGAMSCLNIPTQKFNNRNGWIPTDAKRGIAKYGFDLMFDEEGVLWCAAYPGLYRSELDEHSTYKTDLYHLPRSCIDYYNGTEAVETNCSDFRKLLVDKNKRFIWLGGMNGLYRFDKIKKTFQQYSTVRKENGSIQIETVRNLYCDKKNRIFASVANGLLWYNPKKDSFEFFFIKTAKNEPQPLVLSMLEVQENQYWLGTSNDGIWIVQGDSLIKKLQHDPLDPYSISDNAIRCIYQTKDKVIFVGNSKKGVDIYSPFFNNFKVFANPLQQNGISRNDVRRVLKTEEAFWAMNDLNINKFDKNGMRLALGKEFENANAMTFYDGFLWVGKNDVLYKFAPTTPYTLQTSFPLPPHKSKTPYIMDFAEDSNHHLWCASNCGILQYNASKNTLDPIIYNTPVAWNCITYDSLRNWLWLGTLGFIGVLDLNTNQLTDWTPEQAKLDTPYSYDRGLSYHEIEDILVDKAGIIWLASRDMGLLKMEINGTSLRKLTIYNRSNGLINNQVVGVLKDQENNLWIPTTQGLSYFNPRTEQFVNFQQQAGLSSSAHNSLAYHADKEGFLYFGTNNGLYTFHPQTIFENKAYFPKVVLNAVFLDYKKDAAFSFKAQGGAEDNTITLDYDRKNIEFRFSAMNYAHPNQIRYAYKMEGFNKDWIYTSSKSRIASYSTLPEGHYVFKVKAANILGEFGDDFTAVKVVQLPPFWRSKGAYILYFVSLISLVFFVIKRREYSLRKENARLEEQVQLRTEKIAVQTEELKALDKLKSRFFANISHELRTPLTLILGPLQRLKKTQPTQQISQDVEIMERNAKKLLGLIEEMLELSKLEAHQLKVEEEPTPFLSFLHRVFSSYESAATYKGIQWQFETNGATEQLLMLDKGKLEKIIDNLLSNALKFTPKNGRICMSIQASTDFVQVSVTDNGEGVHPDDLPHIFDRFYQSRLPEKRAQGGTGIGLALSKELAAVLGGRLEVKSNFGKGSTFIFEFPKKLSADSIHQDKEQELIVAQMLPMLEQELAKTPVLSSTHHILIVEDHPDMRQFVQSIVGEHYKTSLAENGQEALDILEREKIDFIISDVMMPMMDGFQLLECLKNDNRYRHLPVLMLTARAALEDRLNALRIGVDDYLTKPFVAEELLARIHNLLFNYEERQRWAQGLPSLQVEAEAEVYHAEENGLTEDLDTAALDTTITQEDQEWLAELEQFVKQHCANSNFSVDWLAAKMAISPRNLQRRLKKLTGLAPKKYINEVRLQLARELLETKKYKTIAQVVYHVGFQKPSYFTQLFAERFGCTPSHFLEE